MSEHVDPEILKIQANRELEELKIQAARELEHYKATLLTQLENYKAKCAERLAMLTVATSFANGALRGLLLINGGAIIGILTFVGNISSRPGFAIHGSASSIILTMNSFATGLIFSGIAYVAQIVIAETASKTSFWLGGVLRAFAFSAGAASLTQFVKGAVSAAAALSSVI